MDFANKVPAALINIKIPKKKSSIDIRDPLNKLKKKIGDKNYKLLKDASIFTTQAFISSSAFGMGLFITQGIGYSLGISCATPIISSVVGLAGITASSVFSGQVAIRTNDIIKNGFKETVKKGDFLKFSKEDMIFDAVIGIFFFKILGGKFRNVMPSNLFNPGAYAAGLIPAKSSKYANNKEKEKIIELFKSNGCHTCGKKSGMIIADHIPPNKFHLENLKSSIDDILSPQKIAKILPSSLRKYFEIPSQNFYPQCDKCSNLQSQAVKKGQKTLVFHTKCLWRSINITGAFTGHRAKDKEREK